MNTADQAFVKKHNQTILLHEIINRTPISRAELSNLTKLNKTTVSSQISELIEEQLIFEIGPGQSSGGRRPVLLSFNKDAGYAIGVDLGVNYIQTVLTDLAGTIVFEKTLMLEEGLSYLIARQQLINQIHDVMQHVPESPYGVIGIGIGVHGFVNNEQQIIFTPNSDWDQIELKKYLKKKFSCPILLTNEANAGAYGEKLFGKLKNQTDGIFVSVGIGVGVGLIINGKIYNGANGLSGELGHMTIEENGKKCHCGNRGCWELYSSERAFLNQLSLAKERTITTITEAIDLIKENDRDALNSLQKISYYLGLGVTNIVNIFDPEMVVLKGNLVECNPLVINTIKKTAASRAHKHVSRHCVITTSELKQKATAIGGASYMIQSFLDHREQGM